MKLKTQKQFRELEPENKEYVYNLIIDLKNALFFSVKIDNNEVVGHFEQICNEFEEKLDEIKYLVSE